MTRSRQRCSCCGREAAARCAKRRCRTRCRRGSLLSAAPRSPARSSGASKTTQVRGGARAPAPRAVPPQSLSRAVVRVRACALSAGHSGRADALFADSLNILNRKIEQSEGSAAVCELQALKAAMAKREREFDRVQRRVAELEAALQVERSRISTRAPAVSWAAGPAGAGAGAGRGMQDVATDDAARPRHIDAAPAQATGPSGTAPGGAAFSDKVAATRERERDKDSGAQAVGDASRSQAAVLGRGGGGADLKAAGARQVIDGIRKAKLVDVDVPPHLSGAIAEMRVRPLTHTHARQHLHARARAHTHACSHALVVICMVGTGIQSSGSHTAFKGEKSSRILAMHADVCKRNPRPSPLYDFSRHPRCM